MFCFIYYVNLFTYPLYFVPIHKTKEKRTPTIYYHKPSKIIIRYNAKNV